MWLSRLLCLVYLVSRICADEPGPTVQSKHSLPHPSVPEGAYSALFFKHPSISASNLILSSAKKDGADDSIAKYDGEWAVEVEETSVFTDDYTLVLKSKARHHAISWKLANPIKFSTPEVVIQYEVKFANGMDCGGAYIKLLSSSPDLDLHNFNDKTPYTIMFGPDKCGLEHKFHFIIRHKNPKTGVFEEKHAKRVTADLEKYFTDKKTHLYTLVLRSDNSFERYIDQVKVQSGNLLTDLEPAINPPAEIDDPNDKRPADWDDREKIPDPNAQKPADWDEDAPELIVDESATRPEGWLEDEPEMVPDLAAEKPADWDNEMDGEWEPPMIKNPKCTDAPGCGPWTKPKIRNPNYKGKWTPPLIANPAYKGIWKPAKVPNPDYFQDDEPFKNLQPVAAVGLELWSMTENVVFDNFLIVDSLKKANEFAKQTWVVKSDAERVADPRAQSVVDAVREAYREKPLFVILIGVCCTIPFILCLWWVCRPSKQIPATMHKKTDAHTPDDTPTQYDSAHPERKTPTSDEGEEDGEGSEDDLVQVPDLTKTEATPKKSRTKADLESDSDEVSTQEKELKEMTTEPVKTEKQGVRKRRSRKE